MARLTSLLPLRSESGGGDSDAASDFDLVSEFSVESSSEAGDGQGEDHSSEFMPFDSYEGPFRMPSSTAFSLGDSVRSVASESTQQDDKGMNSDRSSPNSYQSGRSAATRLTWVHKEDIKSVLIPGLSHLKLATPDVDFYLYGAPQTVAVDVAKALSMHQVSAESCLRLYWANEFSFEQMDLASPLESRDDGENAEALGDNDKAEDRGAYSESSPSTRIHLYYYGDDGTDPRAHRSRFPDLYDAPIVPIAGGFIDATSYTSEHVILTHNAPLMHLNLVDGSKMRTAIPVSMLHLLQFPLPPLSHNWTTTLRAVTGGPIRRSPGRSLSLSTIVSLCVVLLFAAQQVLPQYTSLSPYIPWNNDTNGKELGLLANLPGASETAHASSELAPMVTPLKEVAQSPSTKVAIPENLYEQIMSLEAAVHKLEGVSPAKSLLQSLTAANTLEAVRQLCDELVTYVSHLLTSLSEAASAEYKQVLRDLDALHQHISSAAAQARVSVSGVSQVLGHEVSRAAWIFRRRATQLGSYAADSSREGYAQLSKAFKAGAARGKLFDAKIREVCFSPLKRRSDGNERTRKANTAFGVVEWTKATVGKWWSHTMGPKARDLEQRCGLKCTSNCKVAAKGHGGCACANDRANGKKARAKCCARRQVKNGRTA